MPRRVKTTTVKEELPEHEPEESAVDLSGDISAIQSILQRFQDDAVMIEVYKEELGHMEYCETIRSKEIDKDAIRDAWGGGKFEIRIYNNGVYDSSIQFRVANRKTPLVNPATGVNTAAEQLVREQNTFFQRMIMALLMKENKNGGNGLGVKEMFEMFVTFNQSNNPERTLDILTRGMDIGSKASGGQASNDWKAELIHAVKDVFQVVAPSIVEIAAARHQQQPGGNGVTNPTPILATTTDTIIRSGIAELKAYVMKGLPVNLALDWIIANGEKYQHVIKAVIKAGLENLATLDAELKDEPFKSWFETLFKGLSNVYASSANNDDEDINGDTGDGGNIAGDGSIG